jgi:cell fate regulator YaaT (PSP1 superfamily)
MILPPGQKVFEIVEVRFKNSRKGFYRYKDAQNLYVGDAVVVDAAPGIDVGVVSIVGDLVRIQLNKKAPDFKVHDAKEILRKATQEDLDMWKEARGLEFDTMHRARKHAAALGLEMKISDVEYQADKTKATFYYTAENRVDFRELIRVLASDFKTKIEMRQIGARQEAQRLGGIGSCGRELCCSTWLTDFRTVSTSAARYQQLSINPQKLAGQCGKLKCCLNYELDMYIEVVKDFPSTETKLFTQKGRASHIKTDVFKGEMWYLHESNDGEAGGASMVVLSPERVREIIAMNKAGEKPADLKDFQLEKEVSPKEENYSNVVGQDSLDRFDDNFKKKKKKKKDKERQTQESDKPVADATHPEQRTQQMNNLNKVQASEEGDAPKMDTGAKRNQQNQGSNTQVKAQHENDLGHKDNKGQNQRNKSNQLDKSNAPEGSVERKKVNKTNKNRNKKRNRNKPNENSAGATLE